MDIKKAMEGRRSIYALSDASPISDAEIKNLVDFAVLHVPSAFNSQSTRTVLLLGDHHRKLWGIVKEELQKIVAPENFPATKMKIESCFECAHGTVLFYENQKVVRELQEQFPSYKDNFPVWSQHTSAIHQYAVWTLLYEAGLGASLQHYNPLIDARVAAEWNIDPDWKLVAQMPLGTKIGEPGPKESKPLEGRSLVFG